MPGKVLLLSSTYIFIPKPNCLRLLIQETWAALFLLAARDGSSNAARMPMIAITTSNSIKVKAEAIVQYLLTFLFMPRTMIAFLEGQLSFYTCPPDNARAFSKALCEREHLNFWKGRNREAHEGIRVTNARCAKRFPDTSRPRRLGYHRDTTAGPIGLLPSPPPKWPEIVRLLPGSGDSRSKRARAILSILAHGEMCF